jgi:hypothetical protein
MHPKPDVDQPLLTNLDLQVRALNASARAVTPRHSNRRAFSAFNASSASAVAMQWSICSASSVRCSTNVLAIASTADLCAASIPYAGSVRTPERRQQISACWRPDLQILVPVADRWSRGALDLEKEVARIQSWPKVQRFVRGW